jgi:hypothetical protein
MIRVTAGAAEALAHFRDREQEVHPANTQQAQQDVDLGALGVPGEVVDRPVELRDVDLNHPAEPDVELRGGLPFLLSPLGGGRGGRGACS